MPTLTAAYLPDAPMPLLRMCPVCLGFVRYLVAWDEYGDFVCVECWRGTLESELN